MKTKSSLHRSLIPTLTSAVALTLTPVSLQSQEVVIEGGPGQVQIADGDDEREAIAPGAVPTDPRPADTPNLPTPERMSVEPIPGSDVVVSVPVADDEAKSIIEQVEPGGDPELAEVNVTRMKTLSAYARDLGIAEAATLAQITWDTDELFVRETAEVAAAIHPSLKDFSDYLKLSDWDTITLTYFYDPDQRELVDARERSEAFVEHLIKKLKVENVEFTVTSPESIDQRTSAEAGVTDPADLGESVLEITMR